MIYSGNEEKEAYMKAMQENADLGYKLEKEQKSKEFLELAKQFEKASDEFNALRERLITAMIRLGVDQYVQDPETKAVYKIIKPAGTFVPFREIDYKRTALEGERGGTVLSKKEATEAGFIL